MLGAAFALLAFGTIAVFHPAWAEPIFSALHLYNYQTEIGYGFFVAAICLFVKKLVA
jgi:hypothetical protein